MSDTWVQELTSRVAAEIRRLRGTRSVQWLSDKTDELGHRVSRSTISELENGKRQTIALDAVIVLAAALNTAPITLIYPGPYAVTDRVELLPDVNARMISAAQWFAGRGDDYGDPDNGNMEAFAEALTVLDLMDKRNALLSLLSEDGSVPIKSESERELIIAQVADYQRQIITLGGGDEFQLLKAMVEATIATGEPMDESDLFRSGSVKWDGGSDGR